MLLFNQTRSDRLVRFAVGLGLTLTLSGCFQPMYGGFEGGHLREELSAIKIDPISDRLGHYLQNELIFSFNGSGSTVPPKYRLAIELTEGNQTPLVDIISGRATAGTVVVSANYTLTNMSDGKVITKGSAVTAASYDRTGQRFADVRANRDAEIRDAKSLADQIQTRIAVAMPSS